MSSQRINEFSGSTAVKLSADAPKQRSAIFLRSIGSALGSKIGSSLVGVVTFGLIARNLEADGLGQYRTTLTLLLFSGVLVDFGLYSITLRDISQPHVDPARTLGNAVSLRILTTLAAVALLTLILIHWQIGSATWVGVATAGAGWVAYQLNELLRAVFQLRVAQSFAAVAEITGACVTLLLVLILSSFHAGTNMMLAATATGFCCMGALACGFANRLIPFRPRFDLAIWRQLLWDGLPLAASAILLAVHLRIDVLFLSLLRPAADVGLYDPSLKIYELLSMLPYLLGGLMLPLFVGDLSKGGTISRRLSAATAITIIFSCIVFAVVFQCAEPILSLLVGEQFVASAEPLRILVVSAAFAGLTAIFRFAAVALHQQARVLRADMLGVAVAIVAHVVLIPRHGLMGAAVGKLAGDLTTWAFVTLILRRNLDRGVLLAAAIAAALAVTLVELLGIASQIGIHWLIATAIGVAATFGVALLIPPVRKNLAVIAR